MSKHVRATQGSVRKTEGGERYTYSGTLTARSDTAKNKNIKRAALYELRTGGGGGGRRGGCGGRLGLLWAARSMDSASAFSIDEDLDSESSRAAVFCSSATSLEIQCFHRPQLEDTVRRVSRATHRRISAVFATSCAAACRASAAHRPQQRETACRESRTKHRRTSADFATSCAAACRASAAHRPQQWDMVCRESRTTHRRISIDFVALCAACRRRSVNVAAMRRRQIRAPVRRIIRAPRATLFSFSAAKCRLSFSLA